MRNNIDSKLKVNKLCDRGVCLLLWSFSILLFVYFLFFIAPEFLRSKVINGEKNQAAHPEKKSAAVIPPLNTVAYDKKLNEIANNPIPKAVRPQIDPPVDINTSGPISVPPPKETRSGEDAGVSMQSNAQNLWPAEAVYPNAGAILPFSRIVAYYGNLYSTKMGALGEYPEDEMLARLQAEVEKWQDADPKTPVIPALHYVAVVAQRNKGGDGKYRARMPYEEIDRVIKMAGKINALVFLDIQAGLSSLEAEVPLLEEYLKRPQVHLGVDPEFSMKTGAKPGKTVGTLDASDINFAANYLAEIVKENNLTPKILVIHRYTQKMVTNYQEIKPLPEVQIVMHMDGWGGKAKKENTYKQFVYKEPVQFAGFKLFYKNDVLEKNATLMTPSDLLKLNPRPIYVQYQ